MDQLNAKYKEIEGRKKELYVLDNPERAKKFHDIDETKKILITDLIGKRPDRELGNILWYKCPFHTEKSSSFAIYRDQNRFHCYGCHVDGTVVDYVMLQHNYTFIEAVKYLNS